MKVLWVSSNFLHPTDKGGLIRSLGMLRHLKQRHEIHYAALSDPRRPEGPARATEYCHRAYPFEYSVPEHFSPAFWGEVASGLFSTLPVAIQRFNVPAFGDEIRRLMRRERFDRAVVDFLFPAVHFPDLAHALLFQHNVETILWRRHAKQARSPLHRFYFNLQAKRMFEFERRVCRTVDRIVAVSPQDSRTMRELFGVGKVTDIPTGVDFDYFTPEQAVDKQHDLVFVGAMDWLPNIDGILYFVREVLPLIRERRPGTNLAIVGRKASSEILKLARDDEGITVTGTVPDVRPYLWASRASIVPLRIGGGTRLKIYEAMAAQSPVVSTTIGGEGLYFVPGEHMRIADTASAFADQCLELLGDPDGAARMAASAWEMVRSRFTWDRVADKFEESLQAAPRPSLSA